MIEVKVMMDDTGVVSIASNVNENRVLLYGMLMAGVELVHRMGDPKQESRIVVPDLRIAPH